MVQRKLRQKLFSMLFFTHIKVPVMVGPHQLFQAGQVPLKQRRVLPNQRQVSVAPETELYDVTSGRNMRKSAAKPETGFCTPET